MHRFLKSSALARRCPQRSPSSWQAERPSDQNTLASLCIGRFQHHFWTWWFLLSSPVPNNFLSIEMESFIHTSLHQRPAMKLNEIDRERIRNTKKLGKKRSIGKGGKWKKEGWSQLRQFWFAMIRRTLPVFSYLLFFSICSLFPFFCCNPFFLFWGQQTYVGATWAFQPIAFMTWYHAHVLSHALSSAPATNWIRSVKPLPSHQWHLRFNDNNKALARKLNYDE